MSASHFEEFLNKVISKVKSKEAQGMIKKELTNHLHELSQSFQSREASKEEADEKAILEMGNPFSLGENLNRLHKPKMDWVLIVLFVIIAGISFLPLVGKVPEMSVTSAYIMERQAIWYTLAILVIVGCLFFDYRKLKNVWMFCYGSGFILLLYTSLFGFYVVNGIKRGIIFFGFGLDITTLSLFLFFLAWAGIFTKINEFNSWKKQVLLFILFWAPIFLFMLLPNFMFSIIYFFCILTMFAFSHVHKKVAFSLGVANMVASVIFIITLFFTRRIYSFFTRLIAFINPDTDPNGAGYMYILIRDILSQAGWFGNGLHNGLNTILPAAHTEYAFPYLVYSLGWIFGILLCLILLLFISRISITTFKTKDQYGRLLVMGGAALFTISVFWNILMGLGIVPIIGISLPFISYGGSMLLFYSAILGLILSVYRRKDIVEPMITNL